MHLLFDARVIQPHFPGIGRYARSLLEALARAGSGLRLTLLAEPASERLSLPGARWLEVDPIFDPRSQLRAPWLARRVGADLFHAPYYLYPFLIPVPVVVSIHDLIPLEYPDMIPPGMGRRLFGPLNRLAARRAVSVITGSEGARASLLRCLALPSGKIEVIPYAADPLFTADPSVEREPFFFSLISNKPHKNGERLLRAFAATAPAEHGVRLRLAGPHDPDWPSFEELATRAGVREYVDLPGRLSEGELLDLYRRCLAFVYPSFIEGFGLPILEAMACAAPSVVAALSPMRELAGGAALLFDPFDEADLAAALRRVLHEPELRGALSVQAQERAAGFSWDRSARQTLALYERVLERGRGNAAG